MFTPWPTISQQFYTASRSSVTHTESPYDLRPGAQCEKDCDLEDRHFMRYYPYQEILMNESQLF